MAILYGDYGEIISSTPKSNNLTGSADGESGQESTANSQTVTPDPSGVYNENSNSMETQNASYAGSTQAGEANVPEITITAGRQKKKPGISTGDLPGLRLQNPLSSLSSYTYQITLYMITPDAYKAFIESGRTKIDAINNAVDAQSANAVEASKSGAYIIAQSGGANNKDGTRAFNADFYIDDLKIKSKINGKSTQTASNDADISFNIYEPYGFSLISKLTSAGNLLRSSSKLKNYYKMGNATRQFFILGLRFQGYDQAGKVISASDSFHQDNFNITGDSGGVFERFFDIYINSFKFKIDGKITVYNITAKPIAPGIAMGVKRGRVDKGAKVQASTVDEAIRSLLKTLTAEQEEISKGIKDPDSIPTEYKLVYLGDAEEAIGKSPIVSIADMDKSKWPMGEFIKNVDGVNDGASVKAIPNSTQRSITFANSISIMQAIQAIITQSQYMENALNTIIVSGTEPDPSPVGEDEKKNNKPRKFRWYNLGAEVKVKGFDNVIKDFSYEITYIIQPYETPYIKSPYLNATGKYYGPHKRYDYWYTGKNSEILSYEQVLNNAFFNATLNPNANPANHGGGYDEPSSVGKFTNEDKTGKLDVGKQAQNSVLTSLFSPGDYALSKITINGDPDYLMTESPSSLNSVYRQFYGKGFTINPNGGQVFIEIDFKEGTDYNNDSGLLDINESILFWNYPKQVRNIVKGVSYMVREIDHSFSKGRFTQDLLCNINTFPGFGDKSTEASANARADLASDPNTNIGKEGQTNVRTSSSQAGSDGAVTTSGGQSSGNSGFRGDATVQTDNPVGGNQAGNYNSRNPPNAFIEFNDDGIDNTPPPQPDQGGRNTDVPDLASRNRLNSSGLGGV